MDIWVLKGLTSVQLFHLQHVKHDASHMEDFVPISWWDTECTRLARIIELGRAFIRGPIGICGDWPIPGICVIGVFICWLAGRPGGFI